MAKLMSRLMPIVMVMAGATAVATPAQAADFTECLNSTPVPWGFACVQQKETVPSKARTVQMYYDKVARGEVSVKQLSDRWYRLEVCDLRNDAIRPTLRWEDGSYVVRTVVPITEGYLNCQVLETSNIRKWRGTWRDHGTQWFVWPVNS